MAEETAEEREAEATVTCLLKCLLKKVALTIYKSIKTIEHFNSSKCSVHTVQWSSLQLLNSCKLQDFIKI